MKSKPTKTKRIKKCIVGVILFILTVNIVSLIYKISQVEKKANALAEERVVEVTDVKDGVYVGAAEAGIVEAKVQVSVKDGTIVDVELLEHKNGKGKDAEVLIDQMKQSNTIKLDNISGATISSKVIKGAANHALAKGEK